MEAETEILTVDTALIRQSRNRRFRNNTMATVKRNENTGNVELLIASPDGFAAVEFTASEAKSIATAMLACLDRA